MKAKLSFNKILASCRRALAAVMRHVGLPLVYVGVLLFAVFYFTGLTNYNILLFIPLLLIIVGVIGFVHREKTAGQY